MPSKVYKEYKSYCYRESPVPYCKELVPLKEKEVYHTFEVIPYKPPPVFGTSVTMYVMEKRKAPKTVYIPIAREADTIASPPKKTKREAYKCITFTVDEFDC